MHRRLPSAHPQEHCRFPGAGSLEVFDGRARTRSLATRLSFFFSACNPRLARSSRHFKPLAILVFCMQWSHHSVARVRSTGSPPPPPLPPARACGGQSEQCDGSEQRGPFAPLWSCGTLPRASAVAAAPLGCGPAAFRFRFSQAMTWVAVITGTSGPAPPASASSSVPRLDHEHRLRSTEKGSIAGTPAVQSRSRYATCTCVSAFDRGRRICLVGGSSPKSPAVGVGGRGRGCSRGGGPSSSSSSSDRGDTGDCGGSSMSSQKFRSWSSGWPVVSPGRRACRYALRPSAVAQARAGRGIMRDASFALARP